MIELPNKKKCYNLPEQVAQNLLNIQYLAEEYKNIDALPAIWKTYKEEFDTELETFGEWTTTFEGWTESLSTYLANMSSAAVGAISGQDISPKDVSATGTVTARGLFEIMSGYSWSKLSALSWNPVYVGVVKTGNKITIVIFGSYTYTAGDGQNSIGVIAMPEAVMDKLYPYTVGVSENVLDQKNIAFFDNSSLTSEPKFATAEISKSTTQININLRRLGNAGFTEGNTYNFRYETTFLLSDNLAA